jgi:hypothetical protein
VSLRPLWDTLQDPVSEKRKEIRLKFLLTKFEKKGVTRTRRSSSSALLFPPQGCREWRSAWECRRTSLGRRPAQPWPASEPQQDRGSPGGSCILLAAFCWIFPQIPMPPQAPHAWQKALRVPLASAPSFPLQSARTAQYAGVTKVDFTAHCSPLRKQENHRASENAKCYKTRKQLLRARMAAASQGYLCPALIAG